MRRQSPRYNHLDAHKFLCSDVQRSFGSDWHKKWQGNIGINWQF